MRDASSTPRATCATGGRPKTPRALETASAACAINTRGTSTVANCFLKRPSPLAMVHALGVPVVRAASTGGYVSEGAAGKVKWKVAPRPPSPLAQIRPLCDSTIDLPIAKPMPLPCGFSVKNASNFWSALPKRSPGLCHL